MRKRPDTTSGVSSTILSTGKSVKAFVVIRLRWRYWYRPCTRIDRFLRETSSELEW